MHDALLNTDLPFPKRSGKVRDVYDIGDKLLIVATDRISAFDCVMPNGIPDKGRLLTAISLFWFDYLRDVPNHLLATNVDDFPESLRPFADMLRGRSMLVQKAAVIPIECVARGYLAGSGWKEYRKYQSICGVDLPAGLWQCGKLPEPIFTPATKEQSGHDVNVTFDEAVELLGRERMEELRTLTLDIYRRASDYALSKGVIIADTKFEFGVVDDGKLILVDEVLTPDSSRFWPADQYDPGKEQDSFDKQFVRTWLETQNWNKYPPAPRLPDPIVEGTRKRYIEAYEKLTGKTWNEVSPQSH